jgi:signal peptidase I
VAFCDQVHDKTEHERMSDEEIRLTYSEQTGGQGSENYELPAAGLAPLAESPVETAGRPSRAKSLLRELAETVVPAVVIAVLIHVFLAQATRVYGQSMEPNLHTDMRLVVEKLSYRLHTPERGDIVVLRVRPEDEMLIKRVIGLPGDQVEIRDGRVYVNGQPLDEPYLNQETRGNLAPRVVPPLHVFVMGDNRRASNDSRSFGPVHLDNIVGKAWLSYWPPEAIGPIQ